LIKAAGNNRWGHRDATMILIALRRPSDQVGRRCVPTHMAGYASRFAQQTVVIRTGADCRRCDLQYRSVIVPGDVHAPQ
jgi:hypothetical protein